jgi:hypothetical protein
MVVGAALMRLREAITKSPPSVVEKQFKNSVKSVLQTRSLKQKNARLRNISNNFNGLMMLESLIELTMSDGRKQS